MYYIKRIIITSEGKDGEKVISELDLKPGLNIVYGPSNTGKTHVLDCIDFMLGGDAKRLYKKELKIKAVSMFIDSDGAELTMYRELAEETKSDIVVSSKVAGIAPGTYTANNQPTKEKDTIGSLWLKLMGIHEEVKIIKQIEDAQWQRLTVRTFYHMFVINENRISGENSILKSGTTWTNNIPVPTITALIYLLTEKNYIVPGEKQQTPKATVKIKRAAAKQIVDGSMEAIKEKESLGIQEEETLSASEIQQEINNLLEEISAAEDSLKQTTEHDEEISELIIGLTKSISESTVLKGRYDALRTRYEADMRRLTFIAEADLHKDSIPKIERCPFCNGELPKEKTQSCLDAAIAEADKIELRIKDLQSADEALTYEIDRLQRRRDGYVREQQQVQSSIRGELRPQVDALRERLVRYTVALERAKAKEMVRYFSEVLNDQLLKLHNEDGDLALNFDVRAKIREELQKPMEKLLTEILEKCKYENYVGSRFDEDLCDVVVNGSEKMTQGQGFRAFLNTVVALAVQELMNQFNLHKTHLLVMDSPILSLKERGEDIGTEITSDSMRGALFKYMVEHETDRQTIVLENTIPAIDYKDARLIHFTRTVGEGRYGLIEGYTE